MLEHLLAVSCSLLAVLGLAINILGLPGNWLIVCMAAGSWLFAADESRLDISVWTLLAVISVASLGELLEFAASALGTTRLGGSRRGTALSIVGSMLGAISGLFFGNLIPIPIVGPVIASLLLGGCGAFAGAAVGERWAGKDWDHSIEVGNAAFWGRLLGTVGKVACGTIVCGIYLLAIWW